MLASDLSFRRNLRVIERATLMMNYKEELMEI